MQSSTITADMPSWLAFHPITPADQRAMSAMHAIVEPNKGKLQGIEARGPFDAIMEQVSAPNDIDYEADNVGGVAGWWCRPEPAQPGRAILHLHGGGSTEVLRDRIVIWRGTSHRPQAFRSSFPNTRLLRSIRFLLPWKI